MSFIIGHLPFVIEAIQFRAVKKQMTNAKSQMTILRIRASADMAVAPIRSDLRYFNGWKCVSVLLKSIAKPRNGGVVYRNQKRDLDTADDEGEPSVR